MLSALVAACGGSSAPVAPEPVPTPVPSPSRSDIAGIVFYDANGNGTLDAGEDARFAGVTVKIGDRSAASDTQGRFQMADAPGGNLVPEIAPEMLPPFFETKAHPVTLPPQGGVAPVGVELPIGTNRPNVYVAFGDSLTSGVGSRDLSGYRLGLEARLKLRWGKAEVVNEGEGGTRSDQGLPRLAGVLSTYRPAYVLIDYGTNDYNHDCRQTGECPTIPSLRAMIREAKAAKTMPVVATLLPGNPGWTDELSIARNFWTDRVNADIVALAREEGAALADLDDAFRRNASFPRLYTDFLHPNERGYDVMAEEFYRAISEPRGTR